METIQRETILLATASIGFPLILAGIFQIAGKTGLAKKALATSGAFALVCACFFLLDVMLGMERAKALFLGSLFAIVVGALLGRMWRSMG